MSVQFSHGAFAGSCQNFNFFRKQIASLANLNLVSVQRNPDACTHPLKPLLIADDNEGEFSVEEAQQIANGLDAVLNVTQRIPELLHSVILNFKNGCIHAVEKGEMLEFG